jgi:hypothetical protein
VKRRRLRLDVLDGDRVIGHFWLSRLEQASRGHRTSVQTVRSGTPLAHWPHLWALCSLKLVVNPAPREARSRPPVIRVSRTAGSKPFADYPAARS